MVDYKVEHFKTEEDYFKQFKFEGAKEHIKEHKDFNEKLKSLKKRHETTLEPVSVDVMLFLKDWLLDHIKVTDMKYVDCFKEHGLK